MTQPPLKLAKLWCPRCGDYTRHSHQAGFASCLTCGHRHPARPPSSEARASFREDNQRIPGSRLLWAGQRSPETEKNYRLALSEAGTILENIRRLNQFVREHKIPSEPLSETEVKKMITELRQLLETR